MVYGGQNIEGKYSGEKFIKQEDDATYDFSRNSLSTLSSIS